MTKKSLVKWAAKKVERFVLAGGAYFWFVTLSFMEVHSVLP